MPWNALARKVAGLTRTLRLQYLRTDFRLILNNHPISHPICAGASVVNTNLFAWLERGRNRITGGIHDLRVRAQREAERSLRTVDHHCFAGLVFPDSPSTIPRG